MSGVTQAAFMNQRSFGPPPPGAIGSAYEGGYYAGQISTTGNGVATHYLVVAPKSSGENTSKQFATYSSGSDPSSVIDGPSNSATENNASHPAAQYCEGLTIGGYSDWYLPAINELEVCYYNLKPSTGSNNTSYGTNTNAVPSRASNYTASVPPQTSATAFKTGNSEAFGETSYWTSTGVNTTQAYVKFFNYGAQFGSNKNSYRYVRAVRRVAV